MHPSDADFMCKIRRIRIRMRICRAIKITSYCHVHPLVVVHAPASCGRGLEGDGQSILEVMRRRRRRHAKSSENVLSDFS